MDARKPSAAIAARIKRVRSALESYVRREFPTPISTRNQSVTVFLSGGADSLVVALAAHHCGKKVRAISARVKGIASADFDTAKRVAKTMGWEFIGIDIPRSTNIRAEYEHLIRECGCRLKTECEVLLPFTHLIKAAKQRSITHVLTGFNNPLADSRSDSMSLRTNAIAYWDEMLKAAGMPDTPATRRCLEYALGAGIKIHAPLNHRRLLNALVGMSYADVHRPYRKRIWKDCYREDFERLGLLKTTPTNLQKGTGIEDLSAQLLTHPDINPSNQRPTEKHARTAALTHCFKRFVTLTLESPISTRNLPTAYQPYTLADVKKSSARSLFTVISTFAGGGGSSTGYRLAGGRVLAVNEFVPAAQETYRLNYPDTPVDGSDIRKITHSKDGISRFAAKYGTKIGQLDIFDGSPPCATFSKAAPRGQEKMGKRNVRYSDVTQSRIGFLIHDYVQMAGILKPRVCVMENVPEIGKAAVFDHAMRRLRDREYLVAHKVLTASNYGVPQNRQRLFVVAVRRDVAKKANLSSENDLLAVFPAPITNPITLRAGLKGLTLDDEERDMLLSRAKMSTEFDLIKRLPSVSDKSVRMRNADDTWTANFTLTRLAWDQPAKTVTASGTMRGGLIHPDERRYFTHAELKRIMGLPDDFILSGTYDQRGERLGRMVPPLMLSALAKSIYNRILKPSKRRAARASS